MLDWHVVQWLERGALPMSLPAARVRGSLGVGFSEKYHVSLLSMLGHCGINVVSFGKALFPQVLHFTQVLMRTWWDRDGNCCTTSH